MSTRGGCPDLWRWAVIVAVLCGAGRGVGAQTVRGVLSDRATYEPIDLATVSLVDAELDTVARAVTDEGGFFSVRAPAPAEYHVVARALGYRAIRSDPLALSQGEVRIVELTTTAQPVPVEGLLVETEGGEAEVPGLAGTGFYDRLAEGHGEFLLPGEVARHPAAHTPQLFREMISVELRPTTGVARGPWNDRVLIRMHKMSDTLEGRLCEPRLYIDDVLTELMPGESLEDAAPRSSIEAIEVYVAPFGAPLRYFGTADPDEACGVVLIWTKRRYRGP